MTKNLKSIIPLNIPTVLIKMHAASTISRFLVRFGRVAILIAVILTYSSISPEAKKTTLRLKTPKSANNAHAPERQYIQADSILSAEIGSRIGFSGFDKPYNSKKETFLISNNSDHHLAGIALRIEYFDSQQRMIHARLEEIIRSIPAGETRFISIPAFDPQSTLYYHLSKAPRKGGGQPFHVKITPTAILLPK